MIYAIEAVGTGFIKFGRAQSVGKRLKELDVGCPFDLHILAVAEWPDGAETAIHSLLANDIEKGEWYQEGVLTDQVISWMMHRSSVYGLERLRLATGRKIENEEIISNAQARRLPSRTRPPRLSADQRIVRAAERRAERRAWWDEQKSVASTQQTQRTMPE